MKKLICSLCVVIIMLFAGIVGVSEYSSGESSKIGKYTESVIDLPEDIDYITDIKGMTSGEVILIGGNARNKQLIYYTSDDDGKTWEKKKELLKMLPVDLTGKEAAEGFGYVSDDGYIGIFLSIYDKYDAGNEGETVYENYNFIINPDGSTVKVFSPDMGDDTFYKMHFIGKELYMEDIRGNLFKVDMDSGEIRERIMDDTDFLFANCIEYEGRLFIIENKDMDISKFESFAATSDGGKQSVIYTIDANGIGIYNENEGKQVIYKHKNAIINRDTMFDDMALLEAGTILASLWNGDEKESLIRYEPVK